MFFRYYNAHPYNRLVDDCVKRSITLTTGISYNEVKKGLNEHKKVTDVKLFNNNPNPRSYMENVLGFPRVVVQKKADGTHDTIEDFAKSHPNGLLYRLCNSGIVRLVGFVPLSCYWCNFRTVDCRFGRFCSFSYVV